MKSAILTLAAAALLAIAGTASATVQTLVYAETKNIVVGAKGFNGGGYGKYSYNTNYSTDTGYGYRISFAGETDESIMDFNRAGAVADVEAAISTATGTTFHFTDPAQFATYNVNVTLNYQPANDWANVATKDGNPFSFAFAPAVRLSQGQDWTESTATFITANGTAAWNDATGAPMACFNGATYGGGLVKYRDTTKTNFLVLNAASEFWGLADQNGGFDKYGYNQLRPWLLDSSVAWAALKNPDAVGFQFIEDLAKDGTPGMVGTIYSHRFGLPAAQPNMTITFDPGVAIHVTTYWPADFNHDLVVNFKDYIILESNFNKTNATNAMGDADGSGKVDFKDYIVLESSFNKTSSPEPATIGLLIAGGLALLRRKA